jgi:nucleotide-binding universal stress UspA family protein
MQRKTLNQPAREAIVHVANEKDADYLICGTHGRKGPKSDPTILGATTDFSLRHAFCNKIIVKDTHTVPDGPIRYLVCVDRKARSEHAARDICRLAKDGDTVEIMHCFDPSRADSKAEDAVDRLKEKFEKLAKKEFPAARVIIEEGRHIEKLIEAYVVKNNVDFVAVGADSMAKFINAPNRSFLGSVSDGIVRHTKCHVIICQDKNSGSSATV